MWATTFYELVEREVLFYKNLIDRQVVKLKLCCICVSYKLRGSTTIHPLDGSLGP